MNIVRSSCCVPNELESLTSRRQWRAFANLAKVNASLTGYSAGVQSFLGRICRFDHIISWPYCFVIVFQSGPSSFPFQQ